MQIIDLVPDLRPTILAARQVRDSRNELEQYLPTTIVQSVSYRLGRARRVDQTVPVRAIDAPATPIRRPGVVDVRGDLPAITPIVDLSEQDLTNEMIMAQQLAGLNVDWQSSVDAAAGIAALTIDNTLEQMRGQLLSTGAVTLQSADGVTHEVDFGVDASQKIAVTTAWNASGAKVFEDFEAAHEVHISKSGMPAGVALTTRRVRSVLLRALQTMYPQQPVGQVALNAYLADRELPQIATYDRAFEGYDGSKTRVFPEGTLSFLPAQGDPVGRTELGITQEAVQQTSRVQPNGATALTAGTAAGITVITLGSDNPVRRSVKGAALGMPVMDDPTQLTIVSKIFG